jgi:hypothetical protein
MDHPAASPSTMTGALLLYGRDGCHLCHDARTILDALMATRARDGLATAEIVEVDITTDEALHRAFLTTIPVADCNGHRLELATTPAKLRRFLDEALGGPLPAGASATIVGEDAP